MTVLAHLSAELTLISSTLSSLIASLSSIQLGGTRPRPRPPRPLPRPPPRPLPRPRGSCMDGRLEDGLDLSISFGLFLFPFLRPQVLLTGGMEDGRIDEDGLDNSSTSFGLFLLPGDLPGFLFSTGAGSVN